MFGGPPSSREITARLTSLVDDAALGLARASAEQRVLEKVFGSGEAELVALMVGLKPLVRQTLSPQDLLALRGRVLSSGLVLEVAPALFEGRHIAYLAQDAALTKAAARAEENRADAELGALLGYPPCCVSAFLEVPEGFRRKRTNLGLMAAAARRTGSRPFVPRLNGLDLGVFHYLSWYPCAFDCAISRAYADQVAAALERRHGGWMVERRDCVAGCAHERFVKAVDSVLSAHRLMVLEEVQVSMRGRLEGARLQVSEAWPTFRDRPAGATLEPEEQEAALHLTAAITRAGSVELRGGKLLLADKSVLRCPGAVFAPFGGAP